MNRKCLALIFSFGSMQAMNKITPTEVQTIISDAEFVAQALPSGTPKVHPKLIAAVASNLRNNANPEESNVTVPPVKVVAPIVHPPIVPEVAVMFPLKVPLFASKFPL